ncbi:MAG: glutathione S-transferase family protein [Kangiellaceae bacterium]|nr:glutathione S-transferase family protein [Kangiellaceae bacterium]MCW8997599.1 glutathione S-transferase family protein [Kangiellaceae bacterium]MCW9016069.1 glutathione S-transferase family protein [Kangiellaceae bacterium]
MANLKLTYFDFPGGRAEATRLAMKIAGIEFEDYRFPFEKFQEEVKNTPLNQVPMLEIDGEKITQCNAINRYVGKLSGLYPEDDYQALICDEVMSALEDITHKLVSTFGLEGEELKQAREKFVDGSLSLSLEWLKEKLDKQGGEFFAENRLTVADLKVFVWVRGLTSGHLDHVPTDLVSRLAPNLLALRERVEQMPEVVSHYAN